MATNSFFDTGAQNPPEGEFGGQALNYLRVNSAETNYEYRTPADVLNDIGILNRNNVFTAQETVFSNFLDPAGSSGPHVIIRRDRTDPFAAGSIGTLFWQTRDTGGTFRNYAAARGYLLDNTPGAESAQWEVWTKEPNNAGALTVKLLTNHLGGQVYGYDPSSSPGPYWDIVRDSSLPGSMTIGAVRFYGRNTDNAWKVFSQVDGYVSNSASGVERGALGFRTAEAGTTAVRWWMNDRFYAAGLQKPPNAGDINTKGYYLNDEALPGQQAYVSPGQTITPAGNITLPHGLGVVPDRIELRLVCTLGDLGYSAGNVIYDVSSNQSNPNIDVIHSVRADATNVYFSFSNSSSTFHLPNPSNGAAAYINNAKWQLVIVAEGPHA